LAPEAASYDSERPGWQLSQADRQGRWAVRLDDEAVIATLYRALHDFDSCSWAELQRGADPRAKQIDVERLCKAARDRLVVLGLDGEEVLWELRVSGTRRIWGMRQKATFRVLWWDPDHTVYPSIKKRT